MTGWSNFLTGKLRRPLVPGVVAVGVVAASIYGIGAFKRNAGDAACGPAHAKAQRLTPLVRGEIAALQVADGPRRLPKLAFNDATGAGKTLADWRGRFVLFNLWATWCVPCREEMPALAELQARLGGDKFEVVAVNIDTRDAEKPKAWLREVGVTGLAYYADPSARVFQDLKAAGKAFGMPTTLLIDPEGCELAALAGPAEWAGNDALEFVRAALAN
jgi:thiol-disulfide isomerase/thioredoxin